MYGVESGNQQQSVPVHGFCRGPHHMFYPEREREEDKLIRVAARV